LGLFREPKALALPVHLLDGTLGHLVHRNIFNMASYLTKKLNTKPLPKLHRSGIPALLFWTSRSLAQFQIAWHNRIVETAKIWTAGKKGGAVSQWNINHLIFI
jgi:hypothetical protein